MVKISEVSFPISFPFFLESFSMVKISHVSFSISFHFSWIIFFSEDFRIFFFHFIPFFLDHFLR